MSDSVTHSSETLPVAVEFGMDKNPFTEAREARGWSFTAAANRMNGVSEQQLRNLEGIGATRETDPGHIRVTTALEIVRLYWPEVDLVDFCESTDLVARAKDPTALRRLKGYATA